jgi:DNA-binding NtrC family response regulator
MKNANVVVVEDDEALLGMMQTYIERAGHLVTRRAVTLGEAFQAISDIEADELACDVLCVDGRLGSAAAGPEDGRAVVEDARNRHLDVKIIGFSSYLLKTEFGIDVDIEIQKPALTEVVKAIDDF